MSFVDWPDNSTISAADPREYWPEMTQEMDPPRVQRQAYWHALPVGWEQLDYLTFLERRRALIARVVRDGFSTLWEDRTEPRPKNRVADLITLGESQTVEFKSTARWNVHTSQADKKMERVIAKTVCGFLNAEGGTLLIGVDDAGQVLGLEADLSTLGSKGNHDGYELFLRQLLDSTLSITTAGLLRISFETVDGRDVCVVSTAASGKPVFAKPDAGNAATEFWVRIGNATKQLHGDDMIQYRDDHWG